MGGLTVKFFCDSGKVNTIRIVKRFLFLPKTINGNRKWFEVVKYKQKYIQTKMFKCKWIDIEWVE